MKRNEREPQDLAKMAMALMADRKVAPTPDNFQLFYTYAAGENPAATRMLGDLIAAKRPFRPRSSTICVSAFLVPGASKMRSTNIGTEINDTVAGMLARLEAAEKDAAAYGLTLSAASGELGGAQSADGLQKARRQPARCHACYGDPHQKSGSPNFSVRPAKSMSCAESLTMCARKA